MLTMDGPSRVFPLRQAHVRVIHTLGAVLPLPTRSRVPVATIKCRITKGKCKTGVQGVQFHEITAPGIMITLRTRT